MIPDSRISRIRFETAAYTLRLPTGRGQLKSLVDMHSLNLKFTHSLASHQDARSPRHSVRHLSQPSRTTCPEVLCSRSITLPSLLLQPHVPVPKPLTNFAFTLVGQSLQLGPSAAGLQDLPDVTLRESFPGCLDLYPGCLSGAPTRFFPLSCGLPATVTRSALWLLPVPRLLYGPLFRGCQSFLNVQASRFACHPGRSHRCHSSWHGSRDFYFRAPYVLLPSHTSDMLAVRIGQLTAGDFHPIRFAALSAASNRFNGFLRCGCTFLRALFC
jgi:hypothetical protein